MDSIDLSTSFYKADPNTNTFFKVTIENHNGCCARIKIAQGETCRTAANNAQAIDLDASECKALATLLLNAARELDNKNEG